MNNAKKADVDPDEEIITTRGTEVREKGMEEYLVKNNKVLIVIHNGYGGFNMPDEYVNFSRSNPAVVRYFELMRDTHDHRYDKEEIDTIPLDVFLADAYTIEEYDGLEHLEFNYYKVAFVKMLENRGIEAIVAADAELTAVVRQAIE